MGSETFPRVGLTYFSSITEVPQSVGFNVTNELFLSLTPTDSTWPVDNLHPALTWPK